jgi:hypothetical protein
MHFIISTRRELVLPTRLSTVLPQACNEEWIRDITGKNTRVGILQVRSADDVNLQATTNQTSIPAVEGVNWFVTRTNVVLASAVNSSMGVGLVSVSILVVSPIASALAVELVRSTVVTLIFVSTVALTPVSSLIQALAIELTTASAVELTSVILDVELVSASVVELALASILTVEFVSSAVAVKIVPTLAVKLVSSVVVSSLIADFVPSIAVIHVSMPALAIVAKLPPILIIDLLTAPVAKLSPILVIELLTVTVAKLSPILLVPIINLLTTVATVAILPTNIVKRCHHVMSDIGSAHRLSHITSPPRR